MIIEKVVLVFKGNIMPSLWDLFSKDRLAELTWKSVEEIEKEQEEKEKKQKEQERLQNLYIKYWTMLKEIYKDFPYKKKDGEYDSKYFNELPIKIVEKFEWSKLTSTKLRQYYDIVNWLYKSWISWEKLKSELYIMLAKANYDLWRKNIVPQEFVDFLRINIDMVFDWWYSKEKFIVFKKHFEAVVAYAKWNLKDR